MMTQLLQQFAQAALPSQAACDADKAGRFLGVLSKWYVYLPYSPNASTGRCEITLNGLDPKYWLIALSFLDSLLRVSGLVAVGFVIYGGFRYLTSEGEPENTKAALRTIINALIGAAIAIIAAAVVSFIGNRLTL